MDKENQNNKNAHRLTLLITGILCFVVMILVFSVGIFVGQKRAEFSYRWAEDYHRNFGGPARGFFGNFPAQGFINGHGVFGTVMQIEKNTIIIKSQDDMEETVVISQTTMVVNNKGDAKITDVKLGDTVVVIGSPNDQGQIEAKFIRVMPDEGVIYMRIRNGNILQSCFSKIDNYI